MKISALILLGALFIVGCGDEAEHTSNSKQSKEVTISGNTTLAEATVCLDVNKNNQCDTNEEKTLSSKSGAYFLTVNEEEIDDDISILVSGGYNLILLQDNDKMLLKAAYQKEAVTTNITTLTTLVALRVEDNYTYDEAVILTASRYNLDPELIELNPLVTIHNSETEVHFLTIRAMEDYLINVKPTQASETNQSPQKSSSGYFYISFDEADESLSYFDILAHNVKSYLLLLAAVVSTGIDNLLIYFGLKEPLFPVAHVYDEKDLANNVDPLLLLVHEDKFADISREDITYLEESLKDDSINEKLYYDIKGIFQLSSSDANKKFLSSLVASIATQKSLDVFIFMLKDAKNPSSQLSYSLKKSLASLVHDNYTGHPNTHNAATLLTYFNASVGGIFNRDTAVAIFKIGTDLESKELLYTLDTLFGTEYMLTTIYYIRSDVVTQNLLNLYNDPQNDGNIKPYVPNALIKIANETAIKAYYRIASKQTDSSKFEEILSNFRLLQQANPNTEHIIKDLLYLNEIPFASTELKDKIEAIFKKKQ